MNPLLPVRSILVLALPLLIVVYSVVMTGVLLLGPSSPALEAGLRVVAVILLVLVVSNLLLIVMVLAFDSLNRTTTVEQHDSRDDHESTRI